MEVFNLYESDFEEDSTSHFSSLPDKPQHSEWTFEENKLFENSLAEFNLDSPDLYENISSRVPGKSIQQIKQHYEQLVEDIMMIESGSIPLPDYNTTDSKKESATKDRKKSSANPKRKKGLPWNNEEHEKFLVGLEQYGKGNWRSISRHCVLTKTPTQVSSHAQKYFIRLEKKSGNTSNSKTNVPSQSPPSWPASGAI